MLTLWSRNRMTLLNLIFLIVLSTMASVNQNIQVKGHRILWCSCFTWGYVIWPRWQCFLLVWQHTFVSHSADSRRAVVRYWRKYVHEVLVNSLGGQSLPRKSVVRLSDCPGMTFAVYCRVKQQQKHHHLTKNQKHCNFKGCITTTL